MVKPLFDTNILIDYLNGLEPAREELRRYDDRFISIVSWMEVLAGTDSSVEEETRKFLN
ncbi:type II toxin-antitoxin system VapC family toxin, partial [Escherichia coli]|nr:type II toxin-antitoxin system VapC family toxin [Escherichia coli]